MFKRSTIAQGPGLTLQHRQIVPGIKDHLVALEATRVFADTLSLVYRYDLLGVAPQLYSLPYSGAVDALAVALETDQGRGTDTYLPFGIGIKRSLDLHQGLAFCLKHSPHGFILEQWMGP